MARDIDVRNFVRHDKDEVLQGNVTVLGKVTAAGALDVTGNVAVTGTVDGYDVSVVLPPGTLTVATTNSTAAAHTHAVTTNASPGAAAAILASTAAGLLTLELLTVTNGVTVNESGADSDTRLEGDTDENTIYLDAGNNRVGFGTATPLARIEALGNTQGTAGIFSTNTLAPAGGSGGLFRARMQGTPTAADQAMGRFNSGAVTTGTTYATTGEIGFFSNQAWDVDSAGTYISIKTTPNDSLTMAEALRIQSDQTLKLSSANSWTANGTGAVTISNLAPAGVGTATIDSWLTLTKSDGTVVYVPCFT